LRKTNELTDFEYMMNKIKKANLDGFGVSELTTQDIIRSPLIGPFLEIFGS